MEGQDQTKEPTPSMENFIALEKCVQFYADENNFSKQLNELNITLTAKTCLSELKKVE